MEERKREIEKLEKESLLYHQQEGAVVEEIREKMEGIIEETMEKALPSCYSSNKELKEDYKAVTLPPSFGNGYERIEIQLVDREGERVFGSDISVYFLVNRSYGNFGEFDKKIEINTGTVGNLNGGDVPLLIKNILYGELSRLLLNGFLNKTFDGQLDRITALLHKKYETNEKISALQKEAVLEEKKSAEESLLVSSVISVPEKLSPRNPFYKKFANKLGWDTSATITKVTAKRVYLKGIQTGVENFFDRDRIIRCIADKVLEVS